MRKLLAGLLVFTFGPQLVNATTLVAFRNSKSVVLAADSKILPFKSSAQPATQSKISRCGKYFVAVAGITRMTAANARFNLGEILAGSCKTQQTPVQAMNAIAKRMEADYAKILAALTLVEPSYIRALAAAEEKDIAENIILVGSAKGIPFILTYNLVPYLEAGNVLIRSSGSNRNNRLKTDVIEYAYGGVFKDVRLLVDNHVKDVPTGNLVRAAHFLVDYQISKTPEASGYPIEIVEITAKGRVSFTYCDPRCSPKKIT
ncbi:MAG TPA: hypothetical protein VE980_17455 [Pyrinomonadaceae bacterium]|nr:hypothetical protein [Pyrinomonadaceae bacterium]